MNVMTRPLAGADDAGAIRGMQRWLEALTRGQCGEDEFVNIVVARCAAAPDAMWEILAQLDQYHRRGKLDSVPFNSIKLRLERQVFGLGDIAAASAGDGLPTRPIGTAARPQSAEPADTQDGQTSIPLPPAASPRVKPAPPAPPKPPSAGPKAEADRHMPQIGDLLRGRYRLQALLGRGGMGTVFEALDQYRADLPAAGQRLAIKVLHTQVSDRPDLLVELRREFQHSQALSHPNIVRVHEFDRDGDLAFFTMELLHGALLSHVLRQLQPRPLPRPYAFAVIRDAGAALAHAHSRDVVHGDLKPQNIFITDDGQVRLLDFGAAHTLMREPWISDHGAPRRNAVATPGYASCQLLECQHPDLRDDVYACACVAYELLSGEHPFQRRSALDARALRLKPRRPPGLKRRQWQALRAGLAWERERRPGDMNAWLAHLDLEQASPHLPPLPVLMSAPAPTRARAAMAATVLAGAAAVVLAWLAGTYGWIDVGDLQRDAREAVEHASQWVTDTVDSWWHDEAGQPPTAPPGGGNGEPAPPDKGG